MMRQKFIMFELPSLDGTNSEIHIRINYVDTSRPINVVKAVGVTGSHGTVLMLTPEGKVVASGLRDHCLVVEHGGIYRYENWLRAMIKLGALKKADVDTWLSQSEEARKRQERIEDIRAMKRLSEKLNIPANFPSEESMAVKPTRRRSVPPSCGCSS